MAMGTVGTVVTAALVAGAAGAGAALALRGPERSPLPASGADARRVADLEDRIARQDDELRALRARVEEVSRAALDAPPAAPRPAGTADSPTRDEFAGFDEDGTGSAAPGGAPEANRERVRETLRTLRGADGARDGARLRDGVEKGVRSRLDALPAELNLSPQVKEEVVKAIVDRSEKVRAIFEEARTTGGPDAMRTAQEKASRVREETRQSLQALLTPEQFQAIERGAQGGGGRAGGGRAGGGRGGAAPGGGVPR